MTNEERLKKVFAVSFELPIEDIVDSLAYKTCPKWDSLAHMALVVGIDTEFGTMMEMDDIIAISSYAKAREILSKYGIDFRS